MSPIAAPVGEGTRVVLNFSLSLEDGSEVDSNFGNDPVEFVIGDGNLLPGFERHLFGMTAGDRPYGRQLSYQYPTCDFLSRRVLCNQSKPSKEQ